MDTTLFKNCDYSKSPRYLFFHLIAFAISIIYIYYIFKLKEEKCECSESWRRNFILIYTFIMIFLGAAMIYLFFCSDLEFREFNVGFIVIAVLFLIISIINIFYYATMVKYIQKLEIDKCDCSKMWERKMMHIVSIIGLVFGSILLFLYLVPPLVILILRLE